MHIYIKYKAIRFLLAGLVLLSNAFGSLHPEVTSQFGDFQFSGEHHHLVKADPLAVAVHLLESNKPEVCCVVAHHDLVFVQVARIALVYPVLYFENLTDLWAVFLPKLLDLFHAGSLFMSDQSTKTTAFLQIFRI